MLHVACTCACPTYLQGENVPTIKWRDERGTRPTAIEDDVSVRVHVQAAGKLDGER